MSRVNAPKKIETAASCIQPTAPEPLTPEGIKKYRKSYKQQPGVTILHHGLYDAPKQSEGFQFGKKLDQQDRVSELLSTQQSGVNELLKDIKEQKYASQQKEPLGKIPSRNYNWPNQTLKDEFRFGAPTQSNEFSAKETVFPTDAKREPEEVQKLYARTHGNYDAGEQKNRNYNWQIQPEKHRFGKVEPRVQDQMLAVLQQEKYSDTFTKTTIISKNQQDALNFKNDPLGKTKNLGQPQTSYDTVFGVLKRPVEGGVSDCIRGNAKINEVDPDKDLGKATKNGWKNQPKQGDENRVFGVPTIRTDIKRNGVKSVADPQNYGDEKPAIAVLFPEKYTHMGLDENEFNKIRSKNEVKEMDLLNIKIKDIFESIGVKMETLQFETVYSIAQQLQGSPNGVSVSAFQGALYQSNL